MAPTIHPHAIVETDKIGEKTRIWAFVHILPGARIGKNCNICDHVFIENQVVIGDRVTIKSGVQLWDGIVVEDDVFIGPNATFTNDSFPRSKDYPEQFLNTHIGNGASIGANATILPGLTIGMHAMVGAGAVVTKDIPPYAIVYGNPARIRGYAASKTLYDDRPAKEIYRPEDPLDVEGVKLYRLKHVEDLRGSLSFAEVGENLPFSPLRYFLVFNVPGKDIRGEHAHRELHQFLVCVTGSLTVMVDDGKNRAVIGLGQPDLGLYIPPLIWAAQYQYSPDAILLVLVSDIYKAEDYIREYNEFLRQVRT